MASDGEQQARRIAEEARRAPHKFIPKQHEANIVERIGARVNQAWVDGLARSAAFSYPTGMDPDAADSERWKPELVSFDQVRAELLAVVMANHPEFTVEEAERMLREAGF